MGDWKNIKIGGIAGIEKCVAEFNVWELNKTPYGKFKVKIFENEDGKFIGYTNLQVKDAIGDPCAGVGYGNTVEEALEDTIRYFLRMLNDKEFINQNDFECVDPYDF